MRGLSTLGDFTAASVRADAPAAVLTSTSGTPRRAYGLDIVY